MSLTTLPDGWTASDLQRFNAVTDASLSYMVFDYARKAVAPNNAFLVARQQDVGALVLALGNAFIQQFGQP